ncbi:MAG: beta-N-acetylhexosaminidase [Anaerolineae bacterium]
MTHPFHIIPKPVSLTRGEGVFLLNSKTTILAGEGCTRAAALAADMVGLPISFEADGIQVQNPLKLSIDADATPAEGYKLEISPNQISIVAADELGLSYGLYTLCQLVAPEVIVMRKHIADMQDFVTEIPAVTIEDYPKFEWRAMHLDVCRHFFPVEFIKKFIDLLAFHKMNIFHWHLTEDQGWRIAIDKYPKLAEVSAWRSETPLPENRHEMDGVPYGGIYSKEDIREVVAYAESRMITVMPEIELPGHTIAVLAAYPELGCTGKDYKVRTEWGIEDDVFCAGNDAVFTFLEDVFDEVLELFPSEYIHIGGDECPKIRWEHCDKCQARMKAEGLKNEEELQSWFISKVGHYLHSKGRKMIGWDEILEGGLPPGAAVMSWRGTEGGIEAASMGSRVVMSPNTHCYFDYYQTEDYENEPPAFYWPIPEEHQVPSGPTFHGLVTLERCYSFNPHEGVPANFHNFVMGGQSNTWSEYIPTTDQVEYQQYPRGCALAETLWSPMPKDGRDFAEFIVRLNTHLKRLDEMGVNYRHPKEQLGER